MDGYTRERIAQRLAANVQVFFQGWEATVPTLLRNGWQMHAEPILHRHTQRVMLSNGRLRLVGFADEVDFMYSHPYHRIEVSQVMAIEGSYIQSIGRPEFVTQRIALGAHVIPERMDLRNFALMDVLQPLDVDKLLIAKEDEKTVDDLLGSILAKQANLRQEIAERRARETIIERPSAQIVKLFAA